MAPDVSPNPSQVDPILLSVLRRRFKSITEEMGLILLRTARSPILSEARDFVTGLYDADGSMLEQTEYIPVLAFALQPVCHQIIQALGKNVAPGDVFLHNDVFSGGNQLADVAVFKPIFFEGELVAWAAAKGHQADIGGAVAGGYNPEAREVWQEGLRIPPVKIYEKGELRQDVWTLIFANIRLPIVEDDIRAEIGSCTIGERCIMELYRKYGRDRVRTHIQALYDATAFESLRWFESVSEHADLSPLEFTYRVMTRSGRIDKENLRARDPEFVAAYEREARR